MKIKIYGSRGTIAYFNRLNPRRGGNTSCVRIDTGGRVIVLDCGTGIAQLYFDALKHTSGAAGLCLDILLGHLHLDHIIGLTAFPPIYNKSNNIRIFTKSRNEQTLASQIFGVFKPPYWPVDLAAMNRAELIEINDADAFMLNESIKVTPFESEHSDGTTAFRIEGEKTAIYLLDYEFGRNAEKDNKLIGYCKNADVIIFDCSYLPEDYPSKRGWGHSTLESGMVLAELSNCKRMIFSHFSYEYSDESIRSLAKRVRNNKQYYLAFDGMELQIEDKD